MVPAYRVAREIDDCLRSLAAQTLESIEIIVVDDGSPDETGALADAWEARYPGRIRVMRKPNGGCASARMAGLRAATGTYVGFVDGDDWVEPGMFAALLAAGQATDADIAQCGYAEMFIDGRRVDHTDCDQNAGPGPFVVDDPSTELLVRPTIWRRIYRRELLLAKGITFPERIRMFDDLPFQFEALLHARRLVKLPQVMYFYRQDRPGQDLAAADERLFVHFPIFDHLHERLRSVPGPRVWELFAHVQWNSHQRSLTLLEPALARRYRRLAQQQMVRCRLGLSRRDLLRIARSRGQVCRAFMLGALVRYGLFDLSRERSGRSFAPAKG